MRQYVELTEQKNFTTKQKIKVGAVIGVVVIAYVFHRRKINAILTVSEGSLQDTMWGSFDAGVRYGMELKAIEREIKDLGKEYAFDARTS